jgi:uncharacterized protein YacL
MVLTVLRALFVLLMAAVGWFFINDPAQIFGPYTWLAVAVSICLATLLVCADIIAPRHKLAVFSAVTAGLVVGMAGTYALSFVVRLLTDHYMQPTPGLSGPGLANWEAAHADTIKFIDLLLGVSCCYLSISFILQTKDDFRFVIPYVEFSKQIKGARPMVVDTSVLIDGRITDLAMTGVLESQLIVPQFVLDELHRVADSADKAARARGRMGLEVLTKLQHVESVDVALYSTSPAGTDDGGPGAHLDPGQDNVDQRLIELAKRLNARVLTTDFNLNKVAQLRGVAVVNLNAVAAAVKVVVRVGERVRVTIQKPGDLPGQGVGYLPDGTMVVVEQARSHVQREVEVLVTNTRQNATGRMVFGRLAEPAATEEPSPADAPLPNPPPRSRPPAGQPRQ